ncbi:MAG: carbohydrate ABC transporter permease, partial [Proteobacteria bacterium]
LHTGTLWGQVAAASVVQSLPVLVFTFFIQKHLVRGLTFGAVKG